MKRLQIDPRTGIVYLTEDRGDSLFYRFIPNEFGKLSKGGKLQAMAIKSTPQFDTRNWSEATMPLHTSFDVEWVDLDEPQSPKDDLRIRGHNKVLHFLLEVKVCIGVIKSFIFAALMAVKNSLVKL